MSQYVTMKKGSRGQSVEALQVWLHKYAPELKADGFFWTATEKAVIAAQTALGVNPTGVVDHETLARFMLDGFVPHEFFHSVVTEFPEEPTYQSLKQTEKMFRFGIPGTVGGSTKPIPGGPIKPSKEFVKMLYTVDLRDYFPAVGGVTSVQLHEFTREQFTKFFGLVSKLPYHPKTCAGAWVPRYIRGSSEILSSHAFGTAIDFDAPINGLGQKPSPSIYPIVEMARECGLYWGGWFKRLDGMHFEACRTDEEAKKKGFL